jgi:hypothetical protein
MADEGAAVRRATGPIALGPCGVLNATPNFQGMNEAGDVKQHGRVARHALSLTGSKRVALTRYLASEHSRQVLAGLGRVHEIRMIRWSRTYARD